MRIIQCSNCSIRVAPKADGKRPSCQGQFTPSDMVEASRDRAPLQAMRSSRPHARVVPSQHHPHASGSKTALKKSPSKIPRVPLSFALQSIASKNSE